MSFADPGRLTSTTQLKLDITMSLDGFVAGPEPSLDAPLGQGGERLHEWALGLEAWREQHGLEGGEANIDSEIVAETTASVGAHIMGRRMFSGGAGPWEDDPNANGWWGDTPPFGKPVFVLTHHAREPLVLEGTTFTFVSDGVEAALQLAREAAGDNDVQISGGAQAAQQYLRAGPWTSYRSTWCRSCSDPAPSSSTASKARTSSSSRPGSSARTV
jgi:dihydrofolate reductase